MAIGLREFYSPVRPFYKGYIEIYMEHESANVQGNIKIRVK
jgi:hypothetical protein